MLTEAQKVKILKAIGVPLTSLTVTSNTYSKTISDRLAVIDGPVEVEVTDLLTRISRIDTKLDEAVDRAGVSKVDDIEVNPMEMDILRREQRKLIKELAKMTDLEGFLSLSSIMGNVVV